VYFLKTSDRLAPHPLVYLADKTEVFSRIKKISLFDIR
jgi:hypothetical protein